MDAWWHGASRSAIGSSAFCSDQEHSRYPLRHLHANNCPPASLSTFCPPLPPVTECHARPLHASREAYASCLAPVLPLYLQTSVPNTANDVIRSRPSCSQLVSSPCSSATLRTTAPILAFCLALTARSRASSHSLSPPSPKTTQHFLHRSDIKLVFFFCKVGCSVIRSAKAARSPSRPRQLLGPHQAKPDSQIGTVFTRVIGHLRHFLPFGEKIFGLAVTTTNCKSRWSAPRHLAQQPSDRRSKSLGAGIELLIRCCWEYSRHNSNLERLLASL